MLIIIEGADGTGKTTLALALAERLNAELLHAGPPERPMLEEYLLPLDRYRPTWMSHIICDRWHVGEDVYGPLLRNESRLTNIDKWYIDHALMARGALLVYLDRPKDDVVATLNERGDDLIHPDKIAEIQAMYQVALWGNPLTTLKLNPFDLTGSEVLQKITLHGQAATQQAIHLRSFPTYVGKPSQPWILLLGDERNGADTSIWRDAFIPVPTSSGRYLISSMIEHTHNFALANASEEDVWALVEETQPEHVVALGRNSVDVCERAGIKYGAVPHPQYVRRFHYAYMREYGSKIIEAAESRNKELIAWRP